MDPTRASETAIDTAHIRALDHELLQPPLLGDRFAAMLLRKEERESRETFAIETVIRQTPEMSGQPRDVLLRTALARNASVVALVLSRACYGEERLREAVRDGLTQYVIVGAGLDTFALRHPELADRLTVFEIDHPQSSLDKQKRLRDAGLAVPSNLHFGTCDFEKESLTEALTRLPFAPSRPAFFAWMGVTMYLEHETLQAGFRSVRNVTPAAHLVFDYLEAGAMEAYADRESVRSNVERVSKLGEPVRGALSKDTLPGAMRSLGFELIQDIGPDEVESMYFNSRSDGLHASEVGRIAYFRST